MKTFQLRILGVIAILIAACTSGWILMDSRKPNQGAQKAVAALPELLPRNSAIGTMEEQTFVYNTYQKLKSEIRRTPQAIKPRIQLAQLFMLEARATGEHGHYYPAALEMIESVLALNPEKDERFNALLLKASVKLSLHQFAEARDIASEAVQLNPYNGLIYGALVDAHVELGEYEEAVKMADKMNSIRPDLRSYARVSYLREIHGKVPGALEAMQLSVAAAPPGSEEAAWCRLTLGNLHETYGELNLAEAEYKTILTERENYPFAIAGLASVEQKKGNVKEAENLLKKACSIIPEVSFYHQLASLYGETGRKQQADSLVKEILEMLKDDEASGHRMGMEYAKVHLELTGDLGQALKYAGAEHALRPENIDANRALAQVYLAMGDWAKADLYSKKALRTQSMDPETHCVAGLAAFHLGEEAKGQKMIQASFEANPFQQHRFAADARAIAAR